MNVDTRLSGRTLGDVIAEAARLGHEGDLLVRDRERRTHKLTLRLGNVVAVRVAGRFDPLLEQLHRRGVIDEAGVMAVLEALTRSERRVGELAIDVAGVRPEDVRAALGAQLRARLRELFVLAQTATAAPSVVARVVRPSEGCGAMPWRDAVKGSLRARDLRAPQASSSPLAAAHAMPASRAELRHLARLCHPDLTQHLPVAEQASRAAQLARATAAFHGLR